MTAGTADLADPERSGRPGWGARVRRWAPAILSLAALLGGAWLSMGAPRLTVLNTGLFVSYPWVHGAGALLACAGALGFALTSRRLLARLVPALLALAAFGEGVRLLRYRVATDDDGLTARDGWGTHRLAWSALTQVEPHPGLLVLRAGEQVLLLDVTDFRPEDRATLDRTIARRVRERSKP